MVIRSQDGKTILNWDMICGIYVSSSSVHVLIPNGQVLTIAQYSSEDIAKNSVNRLFDKIRLNHDSYEFPES